MALPKIPHIKFRQVSLDSIFLCGLRGGGLQKVSRNYSLPLQRVHGIKRMYLASRILMV
jgi:hypothetical protein